MVKALLHKQFLQMTKFLYQDAKSGKRRNAGSIILFGLLLVYAFGAFGLLFFMMSDALCRPLTEIGFGWLYFALMSSMAGVMGIIGSVFTTYSSLYQGKDNETLLAMPIPPSLILLARMLSCYLTTFFFEMLVLIPAELAWIFAGFFSVPSLLVFIGLLFLLPLFTLAIACLLGWLIALVAGHVQHKSFVTVALSMLFLVAYFYIYSQAGQLLTLILTNAEQLATTVQKALYPVYLTGRALTGEWLPFVIMALLYLAAFGLVYWLLTVTFLRLATTKYAGKRQVYRAKETMKTTPAGSALLRREFARLKSSPTYLMNGALGTLLMPVAAIVLIVKRQAVTDVLSIFGGRGMALLVAAAIGFAVSMNALTAPSVSLEGKSLWIVQSLPVSSWDVLKAKLRMHLILTLVPALILAAAGIFVFGLSLTDAVLLLVFTVLFTLFSALFGLFLNLKFPNLNWTNEAAAVKQSTAALFTIFGQWGLVILLGVLYLAVGDKIGDTWYFVGIDVVMAALTVLLARWMKTRGTRIFESL